MLDEFIKIVKEIGFPIAVAAFCLIRIDKRMGELTQAIKDLIARCLAQNNPTPGQSPDQKK